MLTTEELKLRDQFAMAALPQIMAAVQYTESKWLDIYKGGNNLAQLLASQSYLMADAMMKAREGK